MADTTVTFTLDLANLPSKQKFVAGMAARVADLTPVWEWAHILYLAEVAQQFLTQGAYFNGSKWLALNPAYERYKHRHYGVPPSPLGILYRTGALFESLTNEGSAHHVFQAGKTYAFWGTDIPYAQYHQRGGETPGRPPQRRILSLRNRFKRDVVRGALAYILRGSTLPKGASEVPTLDERTSGE